MGPGYPEDVEAIVSFEVASQAMRDAVLRAHERVRSVDLVGERLAVHRQRVDAMAHAGPANEPS